VLMSDMVGFSLWYELLDLSDNLQYSRRISGPDHMILDGCKVIYGVILTKTRT